MIQFLLCLSAKAPQLRDEVHKIQLMLEDVIVEMAHHILASRHTVGAAVVDVDGDVEMAGAEDDD